MPGPTGDLVQPCPSRVYATDPLNAPPPCRTNATCSPSKGAGSTSGEHRLHQMGPGLPIPVFFWSERANCPHGFHYMLRHMYESRSNCSASSCSSEGNCALKHEQIFKSTSTCMLDGDFAQHSAHGFLDEAFAAVASAVEMPLRGLSMQPAVGKQKIEIQQIRNISQFHYMPA